MEIWVWTLFLYFHCLKLNFPQPKNIPDNSTSRNWWNVKEFLWSSASQLAQPNGPKGRSVWSTPARLDRAVKASYDRRVRPDASWARPGYGMFMLWGLRVVAPPFHGAPVVWFLRVMMPSCYSTSVLGTSVLWPLCAIAFPCYCSSLLCRIRCIYSYLHFFNYIFFRV